MFSTRQARIKWESVLRTINRAARSKQAVIELERELERLISEREELSRELANIQRRQKIQPSTDLASEEDTLAANLNYIQENITQVQHSIMELEDGKETVNESQALHSMIEDVQTVEEAKFLIEKLSSSAILATCDIALTNNRLTEREAMYTEVCWTMSQHDRNRLKNSYFQRCNKNIKCNNNFSRTFYHKIPL